MQGANGKASRRDSIASGEAAIPAGETPSSRRLAHGRGA